MTFSAFFPGQGSQFPGMGQTVYPESTAARRVFECASDVAGQSVSDLCFSGTKEELSRTINSQIAIFTCSLAVFSALQERGVTFDACAGFSLGEYTALAASGILSTEDALRLVTKRGELMQAAADETDGCMAAVPLAVSGAFHTPLMAEAAAQLRTFAESLTIHVPTIPVYSNTDAQILSIENLPAHLEQHMISPVRWKELVQNMMSDGHTAALEIGPGKTLTGFARRISKQLTCTPVESNDSVLSVCQSAE